MLLFFRVLYKPTDVGRWERILKPQLGMLRFDRKGGCTGC